MQENGAGLHLGYRRRERALTTRQFSSPPPIVSKSPPVGKLWAQSNCPQHNPTMPPDRGTPVPCRAEPAPSYPLIPSPSRVTYLAGPPRDHEGEWTILSAPLAPRRSTGWCWLPWGVNTQHNFWQRWEDALARRPTILLCRHPSWEPGPPASPSLAPAAVAAALPEPGLPDIRQN